MLQRLLFIALTLCTLSATAQWQQTGSKVRYVNGLGIPTKDTAAGVAADSSQIVIRPADSSLYVKYKRTWLRVGGGGGSIAGSGTTNYIPKFTSSTAIGNSQIFDNGTNVGVGTTVPEAKVHIFGTGTSMLTIGETGSTAKQTIISHIATGNGYTDIQSVFQNTAATPIVLNAAGGNVLVGTTNSGSDGGVTPRFAVANPLNVDKFVGIGFDNTGDYGFIHAIHRATAWKNLALQAFGGNVGVGYTTPVAKLAVSGTTLINTNTDNGVDKLQVSGSMNVSTLATTNNLSVTTNATVGGTATIAGDVQITGLIGVGTTPQTYAIKLARSGNNIVEFGTQSATNYSRFVHSSSTPFGVIGNASGAGISGGSNGDFAIGTPTGSNNIIFHINAVERVRVKTDGEVLVFSSTDNGAYNLQCNGTGVWGAGAYVNGSDSALKYQIKDINNALHLVMQLKPKTYKYNSFYNNSNAIQTGFIAQDLEKVLKNEIYKDGVVISGGKYKGVAYDALIPLLVKTIQEQQSQIEDIKKQIEELKKLIK